MLTTAYSPLLIGGAVTTKEFIYPIFDAFPPLNFSFSSGIRHKITSVDSYDRLVFLYWRDAVLGTVESLAGGNYLRWIIFQVNRSRFYQNAPFRMPTMFNLHLYEGLEISIPLPNEALELIRSYRL